MKSFIERFEEALLSKDSVLCIGADPAIPGQREKNVVPEIFMDMAKADDAEARTLFVLDLIDKTGEFGVAVKPNDQYLKGLSIAQHRRIADRTHEHGMVAVYDCKLGDIGDTAEANLFWTNKIGYDAVTFHATPGNMAEAVRYAHGHKPPIGVISLVLMSNPEAPKYFREAKVDGKPLYAAIAEEINAVGGDGFVVGATGHVTENDITTVRQLAGPDKVGLFPGIGAQGGDDSKILRAAGKNIMINVGRTLMYAEDPAAVARSYRDRFNLSRSR